MVATKEPKSGVGESLVNGMLCLISYLGHTHVYLSIKLTWSSTPTKFPPNVEYVMPQDVETIPESPRKSY